ncbi:DUF5003 domain-containing protein [Phocaeicola plebeius]|uniref:DUF5003 domain-containing protein n=1 Tax=Phocaeicola plebeius TaxID=310297 RepID=UPI00320B73AD
MKHLELKSIAGHCKKVLYKGCLFVGFLAACGLASCSDDDESAAAPVFPELQSFSCNIGETKEFTFEANTNWTLESSELWCKLVSDENEGFVLTGSAGTQTVTIRATDEGATVDAASVAKLWLTMGMQRTVIGEVTRSALGSELKIYDMEGNELEALTVGYDDFEPFKVKANFHFAVTGTPNWVEVEGGSLVGVSNQEVEGGLRVVQDGTVEKYPVAATDNKMIVFSAEDGKASFSFPLVYAGMDPMDIDVTAPSGNRYGWTVSMDGKNFAQEGGQGTSGSSTYTNRIPFTVKVLNDDYEFVYLEEWEDFSGTKNISLIDPSMLWLHCEGEKGDISLRVDENEPQYAGVPAEERTGYVLAFSRAEYESIKDNLEANIVENGDIKYAYQQRNLLIQITQKEQETTTGEQLVNNVTSGDASMKINFVAYTGEKLNHYQSTYNVQSVTEINEPAMTTLITLAFEVGSVKAYDLSTEEPIESGGIEPQGTSISVDASTLGKKDIFFVVTEWVEAGTPRKAMVIIHLSNVEEGGSEEPSEGVFSITAMGSPVTCIQYIGSELDSFGVNSVWQTAMPEKNQSIDVALSALGVTYQSWVCYKWSDQSSVNLDNWIMYGFDPMTGDEDKSIMNIWNDGGLSETFFIIITDSQGNKYGLIVGNPV